MPLIDRLIENNRRWAERVESENPGFFGELASQQAPEVLWIGCADSRVPASEITGLMPGEVFVHRNVANIVAHADLNALAVMQYAVEALKVTDIIVCGHYGCGGVKAAFDDAKLGLIDHWLLHVRDVYHRHRAHLDGLESDAARVDRLCELNVIEQVRKVSQTPIVRAAWARGQKLSVHGWIYALQDGRLRDLSIRVDAEDRLASRYAEALEALGAA